MRSPLDRLLDKTIPEPNSGCWLWTGSLDGAGYGNFWFSGRPDKAHRASYILHKGPIPAGRSGTERYDIDHLCRMPSCINPDHLELVTHAVNCERGTVNQYRAATHCINGHLFDAANARQRFCRICARERNRKYQQRLKGVGLALLLLLALPIARASAATDVWLFRGAGPAIFSTGIDTIARWARHLRGVSSVHVSDYRDTQAAYDFLRTQPSDHKIVIGGYSCGGNAALVVGGALPRAVQLGIMQPSQWCGRYPATSNMRLLQDTYSYGTWGLGSYQPEGPAGKILLINRPNAHLQGDNDRDSQRDVLALIAATNNPARRTWFWNRLARTTRYIYSRGNTTRLQERN